MFWHEHNVEMSTRFLDSTRNDRGEEEMKSSACCKILNTNWKFGWIIFAEIMNVIRRIRRNRLQWDGTALRFRNVS